MNEAHMHMHTIIPKTIRETKVGSNNSMFQYNYINILLGNIKISTTEMTKYSKRNSIQIKIIIINITATSADHRVPYALTIGLSLLFAPAQILVSGSLLCPFSGLFEYNVSITAIN